MFLLFRCAFWLAVVFMLLPWREDAPAPTAVNAHKPSAQTPSVKEPAREPAAKPRGRRTAAPAGPRDEDVLTTLSRQTTDKLAQAAREHCSAHPLDCLSYFGVGAPPEPRRR